MTDSQDETTSRERDGLDLAREIAGSYRSADHKPPSPPNRARKARRPTGRPEPKRNDEPTLVGEHVRELIHEQGWEGELAAQRVFDEWADIVGAEVAAHCRVVGHADGQVHVQADSTAWATQFRLLTPRVVAKLNERLGDGTVVRIDVHGPQAPSWKSGGRSVKGARGPRDTYG